MSTLWLRRLKKDLGEQTDALTAIYEDNKGATELAKNAKYHDWTKHIEICHHFVREKVVSNEMSDLLSYSGHGGGYYDKGTAKTCFWEIERFITRIWCCVIIVV